ncbi:MAG: exodeoxyribonuclease VII small subunit [Eubacteriales bacterium]|jgi:exodeoxyribonuclease VII small subunit
MENKTQKDGGNTEQLTVEESFEKLDAMVKRLESEDVPLEESFRLYQEGMKLLKDVSSRIMTYEKKMQVLSGDGTMEDLD